MLYIGECRVLRLSKEKKNANGAGVLCNVCKPQKDESEGERPMQRVITFLSPSVNQNKGIVSREFVAPQMSRADLKGATPHVPFSHKRCL